MKFELRSLLPQANPKPERPPGERPWRWASILSRVDNEAYPDPVLALNVEIICALAYLARRQADFIDFEEKALALARSIRHPHYRHLADQQMAALVHRPLPHLGRPPEFTTPLVNRGTGRDRSKARRSALGLNSN